MRNSLQKGVGPKFLFIVSNDAMHYVLSTTIVPFYIFLQILGLWQNTLTFLNYMMLRVMPKKSKRKGENGWYAYRQRENVFPTPEIKKIKNSFVLTSQKCRAVVYSLGFYKENSREPSGVLTCDKMCAILVKAKVLLTDGFYKYEHIRYLKD